MFSWRLHYQYFFILQHDPRQHSACSLLFQTLQIKHGSHWCCSTFYRSSQVIVIFKINLSILGRSSFSTWTGLLVVFSAKTFVSLPLLLRPTLQRNWATGLCLGFVSWCVRVTLSLNRLHNSVLSVKRKGSTWSPWTCLLCLLWYATWSRALVL